MNIKDYIIGTLLILSIVFLVNSISLEKINEINSIKNKKISNLELELLELKASNEELRVLFNTKFLQEMVVTEPKIRDLTYRTVGSKQSLKKFEF